MVMQVENEWYKPICELCPYFNKTVIPNGPHIGGPDIKVPEIKGPIVKCERPTGSDCLGDNEFIQRLETIEYLQRMVVLKRAMEEAKQKTSCRVSTKRGKIKRHKIMKNKVRI